MEEPPHSSTPPGGGRKDRADAAGSPTASRVGNGDGLCVDTTVGDIGVVQDASVLGGSGIATDGVASSPTNSRLSLTELQRLLDGIRSGGVVDSVAGDGPSRRRSNPVGSPMTTAAGKQCPASGGPGSGRKSSESRPRGVGDSCHVDAADSADMEHEFRPPPGPQLGDFVSFAAGGSCGMVAGDSCHVDAADSADMEHEFRPPPGPQLGDFVSFAAGGSCGMVAGDGGSGCLNAQFVTHQMFANMSSPIADAAAVVLVHRQLKNL